MIIQTLRALSTIFPKKVLVRIPQNEWILEDNVYVAKINNKDIQENSFLYCSLNLPNQKKFVDAEVNSYNGYMNIKTTQQPTEEIEMTVVIQKVDDGGATQKNLVFIKMRTM